MRARQTVVVVGAMGGGRTSSVSRVVSKISLPTSIVGGLSRLTAGRSAPTAIPSRPSKGPLTGRGIVCLRRSGPT